MSVTSRPYSGIRQMRWQWLKDHDPAALRKLEESGEIEEHLSQVERAFLERRAELTPICERELGVCEELKASDCARWLRLCEQAASRASETALREVVEAS